MDMTAGLQQEVSPSPLNRIHFFGHQLILARHNQSMRSDRTGMAMFGQLIDNLDGAALCKDLEAISSANLWAI